MAKENEKTVLDELLKKIIKGKETLNKEELARLHSIFEKLKAEKEAIKEKPEKFSEIFERGFLINLAENALKENEKVVLNKLPLKEQLKVKMEKVNKLDSFFSKQTPKVQAQADHLKEEREEKEFYEEHARKYGNSLDLNVEDKTHNDSQHEMSQEDRNFYDNYAKKFGDM